MKTLTIIIGLTMCVFCGYSLVHTFGVWGLLMGGLTGYIMGCGLSLIGENIK
jgi:hypothetical protein